ncbi:AEC family transporter [Propylenella binzhouense]|uniref:AEC family transporter n=1 Tax=Propylenella binzhouense TaxID=2555902 RepID=A0A964T6G8_9HYPH|nr:AEC family transporter [Propylenella binzhouense]MYZ49388.1 AEC family transporter [Propylenella binzhouense]
MTKVAGLALPFFGLIFIGFLAGRIWRKAESELSWLNVFVIYFALPALFIRLVAATPIDELANWSFVFATSLATYTAFAVAFAFAAVRSRGDLAEATLQGMVGGYGNVGYMGPPLALVALGPSAAVPAALVFCFDVALVFTLAPLMMAIAGHGGASPVRLLFDIPRRVLLHPFIASTLIGVAAAALRYEPPAPVARLLELLSNAAAPCALFALGVTVALRPLKRIGAELPVLIAVKLVLHPVIVFGLLAWIGGFDRIWIETAVLMASLPPAATIYVLAVQYDTYVYRSSSAIMIGTAISVFTVTGVLYLITHDLLPFGLFEP